MNENEIKALVSLLDDQDVEVLEHVEKRIRTMGGQIIPYLEDHWEENGLNPLMQKKIENLIHDLQYTHVKERLINWRNRGCEDLLEGMWIVATYQYPELNIDKLRQDIQDMYFEVWLESRDDMHPQDQIRVLNQVFFDKYKFLPNTKNFHSAANSMLNQVFDLKRGNPISLCVIYMLIAQKLGLPVYGVNLPSIFMIVYKSPQTQFYINVFNRGMIFNKKDIENYIKQLNLQQLDIFFEPCSNLDIIRRVLRNLVVAFEKTGDHNSMQEIDEILRTVLD
jgi:regulator of sirC expression with transglutaminase-like and TPR domain